MKRYRFFYHYRRCDKQMSVHFRGQCLPCKNVDCKVSCETHYNKRQPFLVMRGWATKIARKGDTIVIT